MPPRAWTQRVRDILEAIAVIHDAPRGMTRHEFDSDRVVQQAVLYSFAIIGEAVGTIPDEVRKRYPAVPWSQIRETRHVVVHVYFGVNLEIIWNTITQDLTPFAAELRQMLEDEAAAGDA